MFIDLPIYTITELQFEEIIQAEKLGVPTPSIDVREMEVDTFMINTNHIQFIQESTHGCIIQMIDDQFISTLKTDEIRKALQDRW